MAKSKQKSEAKIGKALAFLTDQIGTPELGPVIEHCEVEHGLKLTRKGADDPFTVAKMHGVEAIGRGGEREALTAWCAKVRRAA